MARWLRAAFATDIHWCDGRDVDARATRALGRRFQMGTFFTVPAAITRALTSEGDGRPKSQTAMLVALAWFLRFPRKLSRDPSGTLFAALRDRIPSGARSARAPDNLAMAR